MPISLNPIKFIYLSNLGLFQTFLISWSYLLTLDLSPTPGCLNEVSKMQIWLCSRPTCKFCSGCPLPLASSSSSLACLRSPWWSLPAHLSDQIHAPHHHLHLRTQIGSTKPCRGPHTPCSSGCMLLFTPAWPSTFTQRATLTHPLRLCRRHLLQSLPWAHREDWMCFPWTLLSLNFSHPSTCHIIFYLFFLQSWWLGGPSGQELYLTHLPMPSTEQQIRDVVGILYIFWNLNLMWILLSYWWKLYIFRFFRGKNHFLKSLQFLYYRSSSLIQAFIQICHKIFKSWTIYLFMYNIHCSMF